MVFCIADRVTLIYSNSARAQGRIDVLVGFGGDFPVVFQSVENPSIVFLSYIVLGNSIGGFAFGWLYWKKGLEGAMIAHIFAHVVMVIATLF